MAFLNGAVQTAFTEELLFRGLIAGSLSRRLPVLWANLAQAAIFFLPHLLILLVVPEMLVPSAAGFRGRAHSRLDTDQVRVDHRVNADPRLR